MAFTQETASKAGKKSKRGQDSLTREIKDGIAKVINGQVKSLEKDLTAMNERERWAVIIGLSEFAIPKLARSEVDQTNKNKHVIEILNVSNDPKYKGK